MTLIARIPLAFAVVPSQALPFTPASAASSIATPRRSSRTRPPSCANRDLNDLDVRMATEIQWLSGMYAMGVRGELQDQQTAWIKTRQACQADIACIRKAYEDRLKSVRG